MSASSVDPMSLETNSRIFVTGHNGMVGSAVVRKLLSVGLDAPITASRRELDLRDAPSVHDFIARRKPQWVVMAAARVGGILANDTYPADFIYDNLAIETNLIHAAFENGVDHLLFLGSSCIYPKLASQPIAEQELLNGPLEPTNEAYAIAKIAGIKLCESYNRQHGTDYRSLMPTNLYGPNDNYHTVDSHVIPGLMRRIHEAKTQGKQTVTIWGSGTPRREFLHVDDLADAVYFVMQLSQSEFWRQVNTRVSHLNVGTGEDLEIAELARKIARVVGYRGDLVFDPSKQDGTPRKLLDVSKITAMGWHAKIPLDQGLRQTYEWYLANEAGLRGDISG